tara:strand:+ start:2667 stop:4286 length:1620 start_codon:yes stop_codon:yes gene_type:complete
MSSRINFKSISLHNISFYLPTLDKYIFKNLNLNFNAKKIGIVGENGLGKSTLLKIILKDLDVESGSVNIDGSISYCFQNYNLLTNKEISEVLGVKDKLDALDRINQGSTEPKDFDILNDDWLIKNKVTDILKDLNLSDIDISRKFDSLSGGECTILMLAKAFLSDSDFIIFDEPTNNLDLNSRKNLYKKVKDYKKGLIIVSHDRELLNLMDEIIEINPLGISIFGGNYSFYLQEKAIIENSNLKNLDIAKKDLKKIKKEAQVTKEKQEKKSSQGKNLRKNGGQSKLILNAMQEKSEQTLNTLSLKEKRILTDAQNKLQKAQENIFSGKNFNFDMSCTKIPENKKVLEIQDLSFSYKDKNILNKFNYLITGPQRIAIYGNNGSGKTTFLKLLVKELRPDSGTIMFGTEKINYFDQNINILNDNLSILDNYLNINQDIKEEDARTNLARFLFRNKLSLKLVKNLSGGEKLRAALALVLTSNKVPELLILDEPTNHLDINSVSFLEKVLNDYKGALLVVSHDESFLKNIGVNGEINFGSKRL